MLTVFKLAIFLGASIPTIASAQDYSAGLEAASAGDPVTAFREWTPPGATNNSNAQFTLGLLYDNGMIYEDGLGLPQDLAEAVKWYRLAAEQGHPQAQRNLAMHYADGTGIEQGYIQAYMWLSLAATNNGVLANGFRDELIPKMSPEDILTAQRKAKICLASDYLDCD